LRHACPLVKTRVLIFKIDKLWFVNRFNYFKIPATEHLKN